MGYQKEEFVCAIVLPPLENETTAIEAFDILNRLVDESYIDHGDGTSTRTFARSGTMVNGYVNYVMFWDGSKEGWGESEQGDKLRSHFIELLSQIPFSHIYHVARADDWHNAQVRFMRGAKHSERDVLRRRKSIEEIQGVKKRLKQ